MKPHITDFGKVYHGDCVEVMRTMPENSVDTICCDPPAGISFMGKNWDNNKGGRDKWIAWLTEVMKECLRVLKPGGMALVWCIPRTAHWTATAIEDAGFEIRDKIYHMFGQGFPKSTDISKMLDKMKGVEREVVGKHLAPCANINATVAHGGSYQDAPNITIPATPEDQRFSGYGTGLKPSVEEWVLAMKPLDGTFAENALKHGVAGLNIDGGRISTMPRTPGYKNPGNEMLGNSEWNKRYGKIPIQREVDQTRGRYPSNLLLQHHELCREIGVKKVKGGSGWSKTGSKESENIAMSGKNYARSPKPDIFAAPDGTETISDYECAAGCPCGHVWATKELTECPECGCRKTEWVCAVKMLDEQAGECKAGGHITKHKRDKSTVNFANHHQKWEGFGDSGGPSRFYYCAKASRFEREQGLKGHIPCVKCGGLDTDFHLDGKGDKVKCVRNDHPTVKPLGIMEYLVGLTMTPTGGVVLDPFCGSGSTLIACKRLEREFIGIDSDRKACDVTIARLEDAIPERRNFGL